MKRKDLNQYTQPEEDNCEVCRLTYFNGDSFEKIVCKECNRTVHKFCYAPDLKDKKAFKCDQCKKQKEGRCQICGKSNGILKEVGDKFWSHVSCALSSSRVKIISFKNLDFKISTQTKNKSNEKCYLCNKSGEMHKCWIEECEQYSHIDCILSYKVIDGQQSYLTFGFLDKHSYILLHNLQQQMNQFNYQQIFRLKKKPKMIVCPTHNDDPNFIFCTCNKSKLKNGKKLDEVTQVCCKLCNRWFHLQCTGLRDVQGDFQCNGCKENNFFKKGVQLPQLIEKMREIQLKQKLQKDTIKFLDSFVFKLSQSIIKICLMEKNIYEIQRYFIKKSLDRYVKDEISTVSIEKKSKIVTNENKILEMFYYIFNKTYKKHNEISQSEIQECFLQLSGMKHGLNFQPEVQNRYKIFFQSKMKAVSHIDHKDIKALLGSFINANLHIQNRSLQKVAYDMKQIMKHIQTSEIKTYFNNGNKLLINIFQITYKSKLTIEQMVEILQNYKRIVGKERKIIDQSEYNQIIYSSKSYHNITQARKKIISNMYRTLLKDFQVKQFFQEKYELHRDSLAKLESDSITLSQVHKMRQHLVSKGVFLSISSPFVLHQNKQIEFQLRKRKLLKSIDNASLAHLQTVLRQIREFLKQATGLCSLTESEKKQINKFKDKSIFYLKIINFYNKIKGYEEIHVKCLDQQSEEEQTNRQYSRLSNSLPNKNLSQLAGEAISDWDLSEQSVNFGFESLYRIVNCNTQFQNHQKKVIQQFGITLLNQICMNYQHIPKKMPPKVLQKACKIAEYIQLEQRYQKFLLWNNRYSKWKKEIQSYYNFQQILESDKQIEDLLQLIRVKIDQSENIELNVSLEVKKLKVLRLWAVTSQKFLSQPTDKKRFTIFSIQKFKESLEKMHYPNNKIKRTVDQLDAQSKNLNKKISKFLDRIKIGQVELYEQLRLMSFKMSLQEAEELVFELRMSQLDVSIQLQELEQQMKSFKQIPGDLKSFADQTHQSSRLCEIKKLILDSSFRYEPLADYQYLVRRIYYIKCLQFDGNTCHKQFMRMLQYGGIGCLQLYKKANNLISVYKSIDKAKKEAVNIKVKLENLLPMDGRKLIAQLKEDPVQAKNIEKLYLTLQKIKQKLTFNKSVRVEFQKYQQLILDMRSLPINCSQVINEIIRMKKQSEELAFRASKLINQTTNYDGPMCQEIVSKYKSNGIRVQIMDKFEMLVSRYKQILALSKSVNFSNYKQFSIYCQAEGEFAKHQQITRIREQCFRKMHQMYMQSKDPLFQVGQTLIIQGSHLCKLPEKASEVLSILIEINEKMYKLANDLHQYAQSDIENEDLVGELNEGFEEDDIQVDDAYGQYDDGSQIVHGPNSPSQKSYEYDDQLFNDFPTSKENAESSMDFMSNLQKN